MKLAMFVLSQVGTSPDMTLHVARHKITWTYVIVIFVVQNAEVMLMRSRSVHACAVDNNDNI